MARTFVLMTIFLLCGSVLVFPPVDIRSAPFRGMPEASQLFDENPEAQTIDIPADTLEDVLGDFQRERSLHLSANKRASIFNIIAIILSVAIYRMLRKRDAVKSND